MESRSLNLAEHSINGDDACATLWIYLMPLNYTSKNSWNGKFYVYVTTIKKKAECWMYT